MIGLRYLRKRKRKKYANETKEESSSRIRFASVARKERDVFEFRGLEVGKMLASHRNRHLEASCF